jgi:hypothetical protein
MATTFDKLISQRRDIFGAYLQMKPERKDHSRSLNHRHRIRPNSTRNFCNRGEERLGVLAVLRPLPPHPSRQDDDIHSHKEPIQERHRLQPPSGVERVCHAARQFGKSKRSLVRDNSPKTLQTTYACGIIKLNETEKAQSHL